MSEENKKNDKIIKDDDLLNIFAFLWKRRKKILFITVAFTLIGILYALLATPWYEATIKIMPSDEGSNLSQYASIAAMIDPPSVKPVFKPRYVLEDMSKIPISVPRSRTLKVNSGILFP